MKTCTKCGVSKELSRFYKKQNKRLMARCMECMKKDIRERYARSTPDYKPHASRIEWEAQNAR